jgi:hypothetical protein
MDSKMSPGVVVAKTDALGIKVQRTSGLDGAEETDDSQKKTNTDAESGSVSAQTEKKPENFHRPKGIRFAILFTCILFGSFLIGYVRRSVAKAFFPG